MMLQTISLRITYLLTIFEPISAGPATQSVEGHSPKYHPTLTRIETRASPPSRRLHLPLRRSRRSCSLAAFVSSCVRGVAIVWAQHKEIVLRTTIDSGFCER